ncbi:MAG: long-chain fatty acid--CoA ligase [Kiritimatiellia bacterium]|nr:long-chain fatty acid--CoA ligase [Kiritimatiellia bacterium]
MQSESLPDVFRATAQSCGSGQAIVFADRKLDYAAVNLLSDRVAGTLAEQGIKKGDRVGLYCPNSDAFVLAYLGIIKCGAVVVPVNLLLNPKEIAFIFNDAGVSALMYHEAFAANVATIKPLVTGLKTAIFIGKHKPAPDELSWPDIIAQEKPPPEMKINPTEDLAVILYTSGTTGRPKGAMLTHRNLSVNTRSVRDALKLEPGSERLLVVLPMFHAFAATVGMLAPLLYGGTIVPLPRFEPVHVADTIERERITVFLGVPSMFVALLRLPGQFTAKFAPLKFCVSGGAALPVAVMEQFEKRFGKLIYEGDGPTECSPVTCVNPIGGKRKYGTVGQAVPGVEMKIMDEEGKELPHGTIGEICVRGANVMKGYWRLPKETKESFFGEWFRTGDLGTEDDEGYFSILDRRKDIIIVNGMNIYPRMIEEVISRIPGVHECAVVGEPHKLHGEIPIAYISAVEGKELNTDAIRAFCRDNLGRHEIPRKIIFMRELPKNAAGKILKRELRRQGEVERGITRAAWDRLSG